MLARFSVLAHHVNTMRTSKQANTNRQAIFISREVDTAIEKAIAGTGLTKRQFVEMAVNAQLAKAKKSEQAA